MFKKALLPALLTLLLFQGCSKDKTEDANSLISVDENVLTALDGRKLKVTKQASNFILENTKGKVVIFDIFATWCPPCQAAATHLSSLQEKYKDDLIIIGVTIEDNVSNEKLLEFRKEYGADYTLVNSEQNLLLINKIVSDIGLGDRYPIPVMVIYKDGKYVNHFIGAIQEEFVESEIKQAIGK